ncbi:MAG: DUF5107 domain-containing protein [bacterium]
MMRVIRFIRTQWSLVVLYVLCVSCGDRIQLSKVIHVDEKPPLGIFQLAQTTIDVPMADFNSALYIDEMGYPRIDFTKFDTRNQGMMMQPCEVVVLENKYIRLTLIPSHGKPYSFVYKVTGHEAFFLPKVAHLHQSPNRLGWWFMLGGVEYTMPDEEHGDTWAAHWDWEIVEDSSEKKTVRMRVKELRFGLKEIVDISIYPDKAYYGAAITITNPTDQAVNFQHWINPMWVPGGRGEITPYTEFVIPTKEVYATERAMNDWMLDYHPQKERLQSYEDSPMRFLKGWKSHGDLLAWELEHGFYGAFCHEEDEGIVRVFPKDLNPGCNIWSWGLDPAAEARMLFSGDSLNRGYVEMWGGITHSYDKYFRLSPGEEISWTEWMYPFHQTAGLHFADQDLAVSFTRHKNDEYMLRLCPSGELRGAECRVVIVETGEPRLRVLYDSVYPKDALPEFMLDSSDELELIILKQGKEAIRLRAKDLSKLNYEKK